MFDGRAHSSAPGLILQDLGYFFAVDTGPGNGRGGDESEHVAARRSHGGRHRWSRARRWPDAFVAAPATAEPTCGCLSPRFTRRRHPRQSSGDHVEFLVRHGHRRVAENETSSVSLARDRSRLPKLSRIVAERIFWSVLDQGDRSRFMWESRTLLQLRVQGSELLQHVNLPRERTFGEKRNLPGGNWILVEQTSHRFEVWENFTLSD